MERKTNKIKRIRGYALAMVFAGLIIMYLGVCFREITWLFGQFILLGLIPMVLAVIIYFWVGIISARGITGECPSCERRLRILGRVDDCSFCKEPLTREIELEGEEFSLDYNVQHRRDIFVAEKKQKEDRLLPVFFFLPYNTICIPDIVRKFPIGDG